MRIETLVCSDGDDLFIGWYVCGTQLKHFSQMGYSIRFTSLFQFIFSTLYILKRRSNSPLILAHSFTCCALRFVVHSLTLFTLPRSLSSTLARSLSFCVYVPPHSRGSFRFINYRSNNLALWLEWFIHLTNDQVHTCFGTCLKSHCILHASTCFV